VHAARRHDGHEYAQVVKLEAPLDAINVVHEACLSEFGIT
jgi:hypothetical protein